MITAVLSRQYGIPSVNLELFQIDASVLRLIPQEVAQKYSVLPLSRVGATLTLAMVDPTNVFAMDDIKFMTGLNVEPVVVAEASIQQAISKYYSNSREIDLATATIEHSVLDSSSLLSANGGGITNADLVSLDTIDFAPGEGSEEVEIVEDNEDLLEAMSEMLTTFGYQVLCARNGAEAIRILESGQEIELLFSDVVMPNGMNGVELAREARRLCKGIKILLTSGYAADVMERHRAVNEFPIIDKPFRLGDLARRLRSILHEA